VKSFFQKTLRSFLSVTGKALTSLTSTIGRSVPPPDETVGTPAVLTGTPVNGNTLLYDTGQDYGILISWIWVSNDGLGGADKTLQVGGSEFACSASVGEYIEVIETWQVTDPEPGTLTVRSNALGPVSNAASISFVSAGSGFAGLSSIPGDQGNTANRYGTRPPIARWIDPVSQDLTATRYYGVIADHGSGIQKVSFVLDNGTPVDVTTKQTVNGITAYFIGVNAAVTADNEDRELRAFVYPTDGPVRVLQGPTYSASGVGEAVEGVYGMKIATNGSGSLWSGALYVSTTGNDTTGNGSLASPYLTTMKALRQLKVNKNAAGKGNNASGGTIYLLPGSYQLGTYAFPEVETPNRWVTIRPAPGYSKADVTITGTPDSAGLRTQKIRLLDVSIVPPSTTPPIRSTQNPQSQISHFWLDNCLLDWTDPLTSGTSWHNGPRHIVMTDCETRNCNNAVTNPYVKLVKNATVSNLIGDAFSDVGCVCVAEVGNIYVSGSTHPDVYQLQQTSNANKVVYKVTATAEIDAQGVFQGGGYTCDGILIAECNIRRKSGTSWLNFSFGGTFTHVLIRDCVGSHNSTTVPTAMADALVKNSFHDNVGTQMFLAGNSGTLPFTSANDIRYEA